MKSFYIKLSTWGTAVPQIIDEEAMEQAGRGANYLNPDEFDYLCEAETAQDAEDYYFDNDFRVYVFDRLAESMHP
jgi:hypothetical protein